MPVIEAKFIEGVLTSEQKQQVIPKLTDALVSVMGEAIRDHIFVLIEETADGEWGIGGKPVRAEQVCALGRQPAKAAK
ncbi:MAG TPA: tautomerase family protein [Kofleriaceae bacterium]|jgi:4-oxalocrotonate tautomerase